MNAIVELKVSADEYPKTRFPYWHVSAASTIEGAAFQLMSDSNESHYEHEHSEFVKALVCQVFNQEFDGLEQVQGVEITFTHKSFGKQSEKRYMSPHNEGYVKLTIKSDGTDGKFGYKILEKFDLTFFIISHQSENEFEATAKSLLSPLALKAWHDAFTLSQLTQEGH